MLPSMEPFILTGFLLQLTILLTTLVSCWYVYKQFQFYVWKLPPGPVGLPILGSSLDFIGTDVGKTFRGMSKKYGPLFSVTVGSYNLVVVSEYEYAKELLSHPASLARPVGYFDFLPINPGFTGMNGDEWQEQRKFCTNAMNLLGVGKSGGSWERMIQENVSELVEYLKSLNGNPTDVSEPLNCLGISSISSTMLGGPRFTRKEINQYQQIMEAALRAAEYFLTPSIVTTELPWLWKYFLKFNIAGCAEKFRAIENSSDFLRRKTVEYQFSVDRSNPVNLMEHYVQALEKKRSVDEVHYFSEENLFGNISSMFFGGTDTTIASLRWIVVLMAAHPQLQIKVQEEIDSIIGRNKVRWEDRDKLPYTMATIYEMQRWAVVVPFFLPRSASETIEFHGYVIPKGTMIVTNCWSIHRDPKYWENPDEYVPERFIQSDGKANLYGCATFSFGKRKCPEGKGAMMTIFYYLTSLMQKFTIKAPPGLQANTKANLGPVVYPERQELCFIER